jgi:flagellar biosynthesis/type III secretory pathway ATPase
MSKTNQPKSRKENSPKVKHNVSAAGEFTSEVNENVKKIISKAKEIQAENKQYKSKIAEIKKALYEAAILNINYGKVVSLLVNETTTKEEKASIVERFSNVKTINEGTQLYDTIKRELNETRKGAPIVERTINAESSKTINETKIYSPKDNASINLMERMENLYKGNKKH